jgi:U3 small nucleolar RNA-associated protein 10
VPFHNVSLIKNVIQAIMLPYLNLVEDELFRLLGRFRAGDLDNVPLWVSMMSLLGRSFEVNDGCEYGMTPINPCLSSSLILHPAAFWTREKSEKFLPAMTSQLSILASLKGDSEICLNTLTLALSTAADAMASSDTVLKALNTAILLETRSESAATRVAAITALGAVWQKKGEEMIPLVPETVAQFLSELIEDENADVEKAARGVLTVIEGLVGDLQAYLT